MRRVEACPVCAGRELAPWGMAREAGLHVGQVRCRRCGLLVSQPQAEAEELAAYYGGRYYEEAWPDDAAGVASNRRQHLRYELPLLEGLWGAGPPPGGRVAEVGCGYGALVELLGQRGLRAEGCDPSERAVAVCRRRGLDVRQGAAPDLPFDRGAFDLAIALQVIEHVVDPRGFLVALRGLLRPGGLIALATEDAWNAQYQWERWRARLVGEVPPFRSSTDHTVVFGPRGLRRLLEECGFGDVRTRSFDIVPGGERLHWRARKGLFRTVDRIVGRGDFLLAVGRLPA